MRRSALPIRRSRRACVRSLFDDHWGMPYIPPIPNGHIETYRAAARAYRAARRLGARQHEWHWAAVREVIKRHAEMTHREADIRAFLLMSSPELAQRAATTWEFVKGPDAQADRAAAPPAKPGERVFHVGLFLQSGVSVFLMGPYSAAVSFPPRSLQAQRVAVRADR